MFSLKSLWKPWSTESKKPPERDERIVITESLMLELEQHIRDIEQMRRDRENEERKMKTGVDYSWLMSVPCKTFEISQSERLELEELCFKVKANECGKVITAFRNSVLREPEVHELPKLFRACIQQVISQRPKEETLSEWVARRTVSLTSIKIRPRTRISPFAADRTDIESQSSCDSELSKPDSPSQPFFISKSSSLPNYSSSQTVVHLPV